MASNTFRSDPLRAAQLAALLAVHSAECGMIPAPHRIAATVIAMQKAARAAKRWAETECSYPTTEKQQRLAQAREARDTANITAELRAMVTVQSADKAPTIELGGDPRGPCARLHIPGQRGDGWGDGFAIY